MDLGDGLYAGLETLPNDQVVKGSIPTAGSFLQYLEAYLLT